MISTKTYSVLLAIVIAIGVARIVSTYHIFCETIDEPVHVAAGMEWLDRGTYVEDASHPPLARILAGLWPFASGIRSISTPDSVIDGNHVLYANNRYITNLSRARAGILPLYVAAVLVVAAWARSLWGNIGALAAAFLFANEPNVLAHAGLVTTDMAATATTLAAAYAFWLFLQRPRSSVLGPRFAWLGVALGLALVAKFSTLLFVPIACLAVAVCWWLAGGRPERWHFIGVAIAAVIAAFIVLLFYRFDLREFWNGIALVRGHARNGHESYLFGEFRKFGWWYYFPVAIALKTTLAFLILFFAGHAAVRNPKQAAPLAAGVLILISSFPVTINIGVRHILPVYPFFAIVAGGAVVATRRVGLALCGAALVASLAAHPDYLPYFNAFAGEHPDRIFTDSNLDWGQDLLRLSRELHRRHIGSVALAYAGNAEPDRHGIPTLRRLDPTAYSPGWAAISEVMVHANGPQYQWLERFKPVKEVGKSIRLYRLPSFAELSGAQPITMLTSAARTPILVPVWFEGTFRGANSWTADLTIENDSSFPIAIEAPMRVIVQPHATITDPHFGIADAQGGAMLYVDRNAADRLHFGLRLRSGTGQMVSMPVVRERQLRATETRFEAVPISDERSATLRIYDVTGEARVATVHLDDEKESRVAVVNLSRRANTPSFPASTSIALNRLFPGRDIASARVVIEAPSVAYWSCITVNEPATNHSWVITPD